MKKKWRVGLALICIMTMMQGLVAAAATNNEKGGEAKAWQLSVGEVTFVEDGKYTGESLPKGVTYDDATQTLMLEDATINANGNEGIRFDSRGSGIIKLKGTNKIIAEDVYGIYSYMGKMTIEGPGSLTIDMTTTGRAYNLAGIAASEAGLEIKSCSLDVITEASDMFYAITNPYSGSASDMIIDNSNVKVRTTMLSEKVAYNVGIDAQRADLIVKDSNVDISLINGRTVGIGMGNLRDGVAGKFTVENSTIKSNVMPSDARSTNMYFSEMTNPDSNYYYAGNETIEEKAFDKVFGQEYAGRYDGMDQNIIISSKPLGEFCNHVWQEGDVVKAPTCTEDGEQKYICTLCDEEKTEVIEALGHEFGKWEITKAPTCTEDGVQVRTCTREGCAESERQTKEKLGHDLSVTTTVPATCTEPGTKTETCSRCDYENTETLAPTGHTFGEWVIKREPTFHEDGEKERECAACQHKETVAIPKLSETHDHDFSGEEEIVDDATCTKTGTKKVYCTEPECGEFVTEEISMKEHTPGDWNIIRPTTCSETGIQERRCTECNTLLQTETIAKTEHTFGEWELVTAATCTEAGEEKAVCTACENTETREIPALGHDFAEWEEEVPATCTEEGTEISKCSRCDETSRRKVEALGHQLGEWEVTKKPTYTEEGEKEAVCSVCDEVITEKIDKLVQIPDAGEGTAPSDKPEQKPESEVPQTGDSAPIGGYLALMVAALGVAVVMVVKRKRA